MRFQTFSHRSAETIIKAEAADEWNELTSAISSVSDHEIINAFESRGRVSKSISDAINALLDERLVSLGWTRQAAIFQDSGYKDNRWRLDFAKGAVSVEVAFNHGEAIAWNLLKPVLASEYNHVQKAIQTRFGVIICATESLKSAGGFDGAVGEYEKFLRYLKPLQNVLSVPLMLVGLDAPATFRVAHQKVGGKKVGVIERLT